ncbi:STAS domain-containing protein [Thiohalobacter thiocyanaticus]|uniref:STAS domain-containing protein n=1 Tax=Thiohalobacter thiocyanaticus TaxID=585455 RepID=UPI0019D48496|nr:STAS domain-containing protein [Thiohalobacter thiocyanaticus]
MSQARIRPEGDARLRVEGDLSFYSVPALQEQAAPLFAAAAELDVDLSGVERADSAGLALLIEWMREARRLDKPLRLLNMPAQMLDIARVSSLDEILPLARD